jgi:gliding motility-associated-like protein
MSNDVFSSWQWDFGDASAGTGKISSHYYSKPGFYDVKLKLTTNNGCVDSISRPKLIEIQAKPDVDIYSPKAQICEEDLIQFQALELSTNNSANIKWFWDFTNGQGSNEKIPPIQLFRKAGAYPMRLYVTNEKGCNDTVLKTFNVNALPQIDAGVDTFLCLNTPIYLKPQGAVNYIWSTDPTLNASDPLRPLVSATSDKMYYVTGISSQGCSATDSIRVHVVNPSTVKASNDLTICLGEAATLRATGTESFTWSPKIGLLDPTSPSIVVKPTQNTTYTVTGKDSYGCFVTTDDVLVTVDPLPKVDAGRDTTIMAGYPFQIKPTYSSDVTRVQWVPSLFLNCADCANPISTPMYSATYTVFAYTANGCMSKDVINVYATCTKENIFIPNTFSPNGDGLNEVFYPRGRGLQKIKAFKVFNRWGQLLFVKENFFANDISKGWNGTNDGSYVTPDVYVYMIDLVCENGNIITLKGDVTLVR